MSTKVKIKYMFVRNNELLSNTPFIPKKAHATDAGFDVRAYIEMDGKTKQHYIAVPSNEVVLIPTNIKVEIPEGWQLSVRPRSGLALKKEVSIVNSPGTIDSEYRGEIGIIIRNNSIRTLYIHHGDKIAQLILEKVYPCEFITGELSDSERGEGGFGSTDEQDEDEVQEV